MACTLLVANTPGYARIGQYPQRQYALGIFHYLSNMTGLLLK
jgi:hypothetical protein